METGYPVYPVMSTPVVEPAATEYPDEEVQYEDMEGIVYILLVKLRSNGVGRNVRSPCVWAFSFKTLAQLALVHIFAI